MSSNVHNLDIINKIIHDNLLKILKSMNKRIHLKVYAIVYDENNNLVETIRIKKSVSNGKSDSTTQETLQAIKNVFSELKISPESSEDKFTSLKQYIDQNWYNSSLLNESSINEIVSTPIIEENNTISSDNYINDNRILYTNQISFNNHNSTYTVTYLLEMRNIENDTRAIFYTNPQFSFLRMALDYFFTDFFSLHNGAIKINDDGKITRKYNEDGIQFNRRITRLFFGKIQGYLQTLTKYDETKREFDNAMHNEYYVNSLLERIDDISTLTYEGANPFGSILFLNKDVISKQSAVRFTVKFTKEDRIGLEDAKRIRKLLELTNADKDLYLIADEKEVYGLGEVYWNQLKDKIVLKLDFKGMSKYSLVLIKIADEHVSSGELILIEDKKIYRCDLNLIETQLISVSFKNPKLGEEGYSPDKFKQLLKNKFWSNSIEAEQINSKIERLNQVVLKAREQKHGTMVVITEASTAREELCKLSKQSTLIEPGPIKPEYIKYLTAIDGAIYFDIDGLCYGIGVILDGVAKLDIGDASRGARYNSAYRYLYKLQEAGQKCVIVIISEDGAVNLIPESENEDMLLVLAEEIIDLINEENTDEEKLKEKEQLLLESNLVDFDWLFNIAQVYYNNNNFARAIDFFERGIKRADKGFINSKYYNQLGISYYKTDNFFEAVQMFELAYKTSHTKEYTQIYIRNIVRGNIEIVANSLIKDEHEQISILNRGIELLKDVIESSKSDLITNYDLRGNCYYYLGKMDVDNRHYLLSCAIQDYTKCIELEPKETQYYWNRFAAYNLLKQLKESIENLIHAEYIKHEDRFINKLSEIINADPAQITHTLNYYDQLVKHNKSEGPAQLVRLIESYNSKQNSMEQEDESSKLPSLDEDIDEDKDKDKE